MVCSIYVPVNIFSFGGILPISIDDEHLTFNSVSARQQLRIKTINSNSWFIEIKKMLIKYNLQDPVLLGQS
jgi:hypothetical protein